MTDVMRQRGYVQRVIHNVSIWSTQYIEFTVCRTCRIKGAMALCSGMYTEMGSSTSVVVFTSSRITRPVLLCNGCALHNVMTLGVTLFTPAMHGAIPAACACTSCLPQQAQSGNRARALLHLPRGCVLSRDRSCTASAVVPVVAQQTRALNISQMIMH